MPHANGNGEKTKAAFALPFDKNNLPTQLFINNEYVDSKNTAKLTLRNPKNDSLITDNVPLAGEADVDEAVAAARTAFKTWRKTSARERRDCLLRLADLMEAHLETLSELTRISLGAPLGGFGSFEPMIGVDGLRYYAGWADKFAGESYPQEDGFMKIVRNEPLGVAVGIVPWNGPTAGAALKAAMALVTGNVFILKPSEKTPLTALALGSLIKEAGFPPGVFQVLSGDGSTGALLAMHMKVNKISFTGSTATGRKVQEMASKSNLKRVTLELGGKSPAVVFDDCDLDNAVSWCANGITANTGQVCFAASRVYVQEGIYDKFVAKYKEAMTKMRESAGDPDSTDTQMGPLVDKIQFDRVSGFLERGREQGNLLVGGNRIGTEGFFIEPTIFENVAEDAEICKQEIFGPVAVLNKFSTEEEIVEKANDTDFGLMAGVFTQDINRALRVASDLESGMVGINAVSMAFLTAPFGGTKMSGLGRENALDGLRMFTEKKTIFINMTK